MWWHSLSIDLHLNHRDHNKELLPILLQGKKHLE